MGSILQKVLKEFCQFVGVGEISEKLKFKVHEALLKNMQIWESLENNGLIGRNKEILENKLVYKCNLVLGSLRVVNHTKGTNGQN